MGGIPDNDPLNKLIMADLDRLELVQEMVNEAQRVLDERSNANSPGQKKLPHSDRVDACEAFLKLSTSEQLNIIRRIKILKNTPYIGQIETKISEYLNILPDVQRAKVAERLVEWWDRQIVYSLCGKRERMISRSELQHQISAIIGDIDQGNLIPDFEILLPPKEYQPDGMLARQIELVEGKSSDLSKAIREEWRARSQRSKWINENPARRVLINEYDAILTEEWSDRHSRIVEESESLEHEKKCAAGLDILRWTHEEAPNEVRPIAQ